MLGKSPSFLTVAVLTLALGVGANCAIFTVVNAVLFHPLPYDHPERLMVIWENNLGLDLKRVGPAGQNFLDWKEQNTVFEDMAAFDHGSGTLNGLGEPEQVPGMRVTVNFFAFLGTKALLGRTFAPEECQGAHNVGIVSYGFWKRRLGGATDVIGKKYMLDGLSYTLVGILPPDFYIPIHSEIFVPWPNDWLQRMGRQGRGLGVIGRLKPKVDVEQARAELNIIAQRIAQAFPQQEGWGVTIVPLQEALLESIRPALLVLLGAVGFVLLIACANVANLLLVRATVREKEIAIRLSLGASRLRLICQLLTESVLLGLLGGTGGILLAFWCLDALRKIVPSRIPIPGGAIEVVLPAYGLNWQVFLYTLLLSLLTGILFGLVPAWHASRSRLGEVLKEGGRDSAASAASGRARGALVIVEVALALVLLTGAGLMIKAFWHVAAVDPGFRSDHLLTMQIELPTDSRYRTHPEQSQFFYKVQKEIERVPGVLASGLVECLPLDEEDEKRVFEIEGRPPDPSGQGQQAEYRRTSTGYFKAMGIPLLEGREFDEHDGAEAPPVAVIDITLPGRYWPGQNPVGKRLLIRDGVTGPTEIIGVVGSVKHFGLSQEVQPMIYVPFRQRPVPRMSLVVRTTMEPGSLTRPIKEAVWRVDKDQPVYKVRPMDELVSHSMAPQRLTLLLLGAFSLLATLLASVGTYGVMSYSVSQRTRDIGIRMALGADSGHVRKVVMKQGLLMVLVGVGAGLVVSLGLSRYLSSLLYQVSATDPSTYLSVVLLLTGVALLACFLPAHRAARVDPMVALRHQ
jgi:putative ABC transport system permease protein